MQRRQFLTRVSAGVLGVGVAGCTNLIETEAVREEGGGGEPPLVEDRPDAVYIPTHREGMEMIGMGEAGDYTVGLTYSFPHRFWTVTGTDTESVNIRSDDDVHLMASVWDDETDTVLPVGAGLSMEIERSGEFITEKSPWPMLSQNMGFHYGDNFSLDGDGTYTVTVSIGGMDIPRFGDLNGKFEERASTTIEFDYSAEDRDEITFEQFEDRQGEREALDLMEMDMMPVSTVLAPEGLPGRVVGEGESGDASFVVSVIEDGSFVDAESAYLLVSPRTPYNRIPLPMMSISFTIERDGEVIDEESLQDGIEPSAGYHYGAAIEDIITGDILKLNVESPPQASRHEGYETAFIEMPSVELTVG